MARFAVRGVAVGFWYKCCLGSHAGADAPPFLLRMATDIAPASVASGRAVPIGAVYRRGLHAMLLLVVRGSVPRGVCLDPHFPDSPTFRGKIHNRLRVLTLFEILSRGQTRPHAMERQEIKG